MKKIYSLMLAVLAGMTISAQALLKIVKTSEGVYTMTYNDSANGWAFYDPFSQPIGVYLFINPGDTTPSGTFNDAWSNITTTLNWDGTNYSGTINLNTHNFNNTGGVLPPGTKVNELRFLFTEAPAGNGGHQTADKLGTSYGFTPSTISSLAVADVNGKTKSQVAAGKLFTSAKGNLDITVYDFGGKVIKNLKVNANGNPIDLNLSQKGMYLMTISGNAISEAVKFSY